MHKIINVNVLQNYRVKLKFGDGHQGIADLSHHVGKVVLVVNILFLALKAGFPWHVFLRTCVQARRGGIGR